MKVITSIYLNCRPDLRDEWLAGNELEDPGDSAVSNRQISARPSKLCLDAWPLGSRTGAPDAREILCVYL